MRGSELPGAHGHEVSGVVTSVGDAVLDLRRPRLPRAGPRASCGTCAPASPATRSCRDRSTLPVWGFADAIVVPARGVVPVPAGLDLEVACLAEPLASAVHGIRHSWSAAGRRPDRRPRVAVVGAGAIGLCAVLAARALGAAEVTVVARHEHQARVAGPSARIACSTTSGDAPSLRRLRPQLVVEAAGGDGSALETAFAAVADGGEVVVLGLPDYRRRPRRAAARPPERACLLRRRLRDARRRLGLLDRARPPRGDRRRRSADHASVPA